MPTPDEFSRWLKGYRDAFTDLDAESAGELFSDDAMYYESPFARVMGDVEFGFEVLATTDDVGVARVNDALTRVPSGRRVRYDGIFFARFDEELRCNEFREWWVEQPAGSEPAIR